MFTWYQYVYLIFNIDNLFTSDLINIKYEVNIINIKYWVNIINIKY